MTTSYRAGDVFDGSWWSTDRDECEYYCILGEDRPLWTATVEAAQASDDVMEMEEIGALEDMTYGDMEAAVEVLRGAYPGVAMVNLGQEGSGDSCVLIRSWMVTAERIGTVAAA